MLPYGVVYVVDCVYTSGWHGQISLIIFPSLLAWYAVVGQ